MSNQLLVSTRKGLFVVGRGPDGWRVKQTSFLGQNATLALPANGHGWFAALNLGHFGVKLHHSPDEGRTWEERAVPTYPEGENVVLGDGKPPRPANLQMIWSLEAGGPSQNGRLWAGTLPGGLFRSDDLGRSWELVRGLWDRPERQRWFGGGYDVPGMHSVCVDPRDANVLRVAISSGGVWISEDGGESWKVVGNGLRYADNMGFPPEALGDLLTQDVHRMVQCPASPERMWIQHHCGVFRSDDGGTNWSAVPDVRPSVFGFAVAVHPRQPDAAWFVPAVKDECRVPVDGKLVVSRTRDGGRSFEVLTRGLPQESSYDLVYRHGLAIDGSGERLAIGSTTGGVWVSEDQGDSWRALAERLPPVHAVTFV
jgi:hypothetical protein